MQTRQHALRIYDAALRGVDAETAVRGAIRREHGSLLVGGTRVEPPKAGGRLLVLAVGKAAPGMTRGALAALQGMVDDGIVTTTHPAATPLAPLTVFGAGHPLPDAGSLAAAAESLNLARGAGPDDLILCLISGGASALWAAPPAGVMLGDLREITEALLHAGAAIGELNIVRRKLSRISGGRLARAAAPARIITLAISDVIDASPPIIGSGPTVRDPARFADALEVLAKYDVHAPAATLGFLQQGAATEEGSEAETDGSDSPFYIVADLSDALEDARAAAERLGYRTALVTSRMSGEARVTGSEIASFVLSAARAAGGERRALIWGGETTVTVRGRGRGGRSQELALSAARMLDGLDGVLILAAGTDGVDGPTRAAGALIDGGTLSRARKAGFSADDALARNDSFPLLEAIGDLVVTGPTGTNVGDLVIALIEPEQD